MAPGYPKFTEAELIHFFGGPLLAEHHSLVGGAIIRWNPNSHRLSHVLEHDEEIAEAFAQYVVSKGRDFRFIDELVEYARMHQWSGWEKIKKEYEDPDDDFDTIDL